MPKIKRALISVSDKSGIVDIAKVLQKFGVEILSTGGTAKTLRDNKIPVVEVSDYTGSPEILDGRLKTLHPKIHGGILGQRANKKHIQEMTKNDIGPIDMVIVNLYPFETTVAKPGCSLEDAIENIDIGGPAMLRAAAKNWHDVAVVADPADYAKIVEELVSRHGEISKETCFKLAQRVFSLTARYDAAICNYLNSIDDDTRTRFPTTLAMTFNKVCDLRYGENPHQSAAFYKCPYLPRDVPCIANARQLHGKELSYNNIMDADAAIELAREFCGGTAAVVIKHTNPCGAAVSEKSLAEAFIAARDCDPISAFGGIVAVTKRMDAETARAISDTFFEVIIAPGFEAEALEILKAKKNLRLLELCTVPSTPPLEKGGEGRFYNLRKVGGGLLVQDLDVAPTDVSSCKVVTKKSPAKEELEALDFAWRIVRHVKSNAIVISARDRILGVGAGQTSRVDSVKIAIIKLNNLPPLEKGGKGGFAVRVMASDAFFPFRDGVDLAAGAGITAIIQPGGSIRDAEVISAADEHKVAMIFTGTRHFRH